MATAEPKLLRHAGRLFGLDGPATLEQLAQRAEAWRPFRTWVTVLIRLAGERGTF
jgi:3-methyladenine DNA glycosylase/8-oxoguanine DNA glycosylase